MTRLFRIDEDVWSSSLGKVSVLVNESMSRLMMAGIVVLNPGQRLPAEGYSLHELSDELSYVVEGEVVFGTESSERLLRAGDLFFNPKGTRHYVRNDADKPCRVIWVLSPPIKL
ncbi:MAG: cupin domain-containing protein [Nitrososphaerota archaeon]